MGFDGLRNFWTKWEQTILTFVAIVIVGASSYLFGLTHQSDSRETLAIATTAGYNTVLCNAQCDTLGIDSDVAGVVSADESISPSLDITIDDASTCLFVGSINGSKYYPPECKAINRIKKENLTCFSSEQEAQEKGYSLTKSC